MINLCENLDLDCVVEGIENAEAKKDILQDARTADTCKAICSPSRCPADRVLGFISGMGRGARLQSAQLARGA